MTGPPKRRVWAVARAKIWLACSCARRAEICGVARRMAALAAVFWAAGVSLRHAALILLNTRLTAGSPCAFKAGEKQRVNPTNKINFLIFILSDFWRRGARVIGPNISWVFGPIQAEIKNPAVGRGLRCGKSVQPRVEWEFIQKHFYLLGNFRQARVVLRVGNSRIYKRGNLGHIGFFHPAGGDGRRAQA